MKLSCSFELPGYGDRKRPSMVSMSACAGLIGGHNQAKANIC